jgi:DNA-binding MarR family transcriptional regulator
MVESYYATDNLEPDRSIGFLIKRCGVLMTQIADRGFAAEPFNLLQWQLLICLLNSSHLTPTELSDQLGHDMGALTRVVDELERNGLARRKRSQHDRRAVQIAVTAEGKRQAEAGKRILVPILNGLLEPYSKAQVDALISLLQGLLSRMELALQAPRSGQTAAPKTSRAMRRKSAATSADRDEASSESDS